MRRELIGFRRHLRVEVVPDDATYLISEHGITALRAPHLEAVAPLLDGSRDLAALLRDTPAPLPTERLTALLAQLADAGFIEYREQRGCEPTEHSAEAYWELAGLEGRPTRLRTASTLVELRTVGDLDARHAVRALRASALAVTAEPAPDAALTVVICDDYLAPRLGDLDAEFRAAGRPWLLAKPTGATVWVGPVFRPGAGACWSCLAHPVRLHRGVESRVGAALGRTGPVPGPAAWVPCTLATGLHLAAIEAAQWLAGHHRVQDRVLTFDTLTQVSRHHVVRRRPQCPDCGDPGLGAGLALAPVVPRSRPKAPDAGGGHRSRSVQQMRDAYDHLISPITGIVADVTRVTGGPAFLNSFSSGPSPVPGTTGLAALLRGLRHVNGGKGVTAQEAEVSALCEAVERYSGCLHGDEPRIRATHRELGDLAVHPDSCQLFADEQFTGRAEWNAGHSGFHRVPERFDEDAAIDWTPVWSLTAHRHRLLPSALLYFSTAAEHRHPVAGRRFAHADSNGNAAGSSLEDAVLQGFLELVERDAVALWWYNRTRQPALDLHSADDPWVRELLDVHRALHREVWTLDLTSDFGIPVFAALSRRTDKQAQDIVFGFGAHLDARIALRRALTELNQLLPAALDARPDGSGYTLTDPEPLGWWRTATTGNQPYLCPAEGPARTLADFPLPTSTDLREDLTTVTDAVRARGLDLLVLDQTRPDVGLPVVKVLVPGLRSFWARFAPGRLYDVPVALGRLPRPLDPPELNPVPLFV
ncbi:TOMM precursor leader peptide-binding protein [Streptomyces sp. enrichment culture]|uniref:TOMM precursor leader peptide-binding protein n=1 Tax=Streptomyces sp. enrichment culture TaxID=1795815 RepID=UPI003F57F4D1